MLERGSRRAGLVVAAVAIFFLPCGCRRSRGTAYEGYAFVAAAGSSTLAVVDLTTFSVTKRLSLSSRPMQLVSDPARRRIYVMGDGGAAGLTVVDAAKLDLRSSMWLADHPRRIRLSPDSNRLYVLDARARVFKFVELDRLSHGRQIALGAAPQELDVSPDGQRACITMASGETAIVDLAGWKITATLPVGGESAAVAIRHDGRCAFIADRNRGSVWAIDLATGRIVTQLPISARPEVIRFKPDGGELFVSGGDRGVVMILSAYRGEVDQPLLAGVEPRDIAITRDNRLLFVANSGSGSVTVMNITDRRVLASVPVGDEPHRVVLTPDDQYALVLNRKSGDMAVIRVAAISGGREQIPPLFTMIPVGSEPLDVTVQPAK